MSLIYYKEGITSVIDLDGNPYDLGITYPSIFPKKVSLPEYGGAEKFILIAATGLNGGVFVSDDGFVWNHHGPFIYGSGSNIGSQEYENINIRSPRIIGQSDDDGYHTIATAFIDSGSEGSSFTGLFRVESPLGPFRFSRALITGVEGSIYDIHGKRMLIGHNSDNSNIQGYSIIGEPDNLVIDEAQEVLEFLRPQIGEQFRDLVEAAHPFMLGNDLWLLVSTRDDNKRFKQRVMAYRVSKDNSRGVYMFETEAGIRSRTSDTKWLKEYVKNQIQYLSPSEIEEMNGRGESVADVLINDWLNGVVLRPSVDFPVIGHGSIRMINERNGWSYCHAVPSNLIDWDKVDSAQSKTNELDSLRKLCIVAMTTWQVRKTLFPRFGKFGVVVNS